MNAEKRKFIVGNTYTTRSICDHDCIFSFKVIKRTEKTVTITSSFGTVRRKIGYDYCDGSEFIAPLGLYSMSPTLTA